MTGFDMPSHACNTHLHIIDPSFPNDGCAAAQIGTVKHYRTVADIFKLERAVFVQAKPFGIDNSCLLDAIEKFGREYARGIAVVDTSISESELSDLHKAGIRGLRYSVWNPNNAVVKFQDASVLAERIGALDWNIQIHCSGAQLTQWENEIRSLPTKVVIDHMGRLDPGLGTNDPAFKTLLRLIDQGNVWVKLSGPYLNTSGHAPWEDATLLARGLAEYAPERVLWGSDFPHVTESIKPDPVALTNLISEWLPSEKARQLALVDNPTQIYGF